MRSVEVSMLMAVAFRAVKVAAVYVASAMVDDSRLNRLAGEEDIGSQEDCHLRLMDLGDRTNRELTSIDRVYVFQLGKRRFSCNAHEQMR
jgi:hypothetical protein